MTVLRKYIVSIMLTLCFGLLMGCSAERVTVVTLDGPLRGEVHGDTRVFLGIPYAAPPTGALRFAPPADVPTWTAPRDAVELKPNCAQLIFATDIVQDSSSEDCLYVNVWAPTDGNQHPVMVFIPGGAYIIDGADDPTIDGQRLSERGDVVVVTMNYRLGPFGFLAHEALRKENARSSGDYALLDQRKALQWVQKNISHFGGDASNVTMFGESAGGGSACAQLVAPGSAGLFQKAILESAPCTAYPLPTREEAEQQGKEFTQALGCKGGDAEVLACIRGASTSRVLKALKLNTYVLFGQGVPWTPIVDGVTLQEQPVKLLGRGVSKDIPLLVGANADEGSLFFVLPRTIEGDNDLRAMAKEVFREARVDAVMKRYGGSDDPQASAQRAITEAWVCDARRIARLHTQAGGTAHHYHFTVKLYDALIGLDALHGAEVPFVFGNSFKGIPILPAGIPLKNKMQGYWTNFARTGDPNGDGPRWPVYSAASDESLRLSLQVSTIKEVMREGCDFWDSLMQ